jgi:murein DD-endopeptidase MepM/ murein hydrolase activator NlpD
MRVVKDKFETINLTLPEEKVSPSPENIVRIEKEADLLNSIWQIYSERLWKGDFLLPLQNPLSTPFGTKRIINVETVSIHKGLDMKGEEGEEIKASNTGRVVLADELFFGGNTIILDHGQGIFTIYMHMSGFIVSPGDLVSKNDTIGFVGSTGRSTGPHLHFGVKVAGINANPVSLTDLKL